MKQQCIFITGPESSGSTLVARIVSQALGNPSWSGRGFNCCDNGQCDADNGYIKPCITTEPLICHRSLPFKHFWPPIEDWKTIYKGKYIICTRDKTISRNSQLGRFDWKSDDLLQQEEQQVSNIIEDLISDADTPFFIWSYETYILLGKPYLFMLADFLDIPRERFEQTEPPRNENKKYIPPFKRKSALAKYFSKFNLL